MHKIEDVDRQWDLLMNTINDYIESPRKEKLTKMYEGLAEKICTAPASSHSTRHNCFPGGYIDHVNRVVKCSLELYSTWQTAGANVSNFTKEELVFAALNHDLGKIGNAKEDYYIPNDSDWHVKRGQVYKINGSENEFLAIKLHDGLYSKGNESYLMGGLPEFSLNCDMPILLHHADHLATLIEGNFNHTSETVKQEPKVKSKLSNIGDQVTNENLKSAFDEIFGTP